MLEAEDKGLVWGCVWAVGLWGGSICFDCEGAQYEPPAVGGIRSPVRCALAGTRLCWLHVMQGWGQAELGVGLLWP